ncbi:MAG TPA: chemotaxis protein CheB [Cytophagaceae bacterium]|jgi:two-component system CheB/CheR fusion protein
MDTPDLKGGLNLNYSFERQSKHYVVGIGASAGGLEALQQLLSSIPSDTGLSFIVVLHLSPDYKSLMPELLSRCTQMNVQVAEEDATIIPDNVYIIPIKKYIVVDNHKIKLLDKIPTYHSPNTSIDIFLTSLAHQYKEKAVAIILSGTGTDGTKGIEEIKKFGGLTIIQEPMSAKFDGMPLSAIGSGKADYILPPQLVYGAIHNFIQEDNYLKNLIESGNFASQDDIEVLDEILYHVKASRGIDFTAYKRPTITRRIIRRMGVNNLKTLDQYCKLLKANSEETEHLANEFLINITKFFRDNEAFHQIEHSIIPEIFKNKSFKDPVKFWVVGCSTGEEAYSFAILVHEYLKKTKQVYDVKIFATDIDKEAVEYASKGCYAEGSVLHLSKDRLESYFTKEGSKYKVTVEIRKMVVFAQQDVATNPPYNKIDLLSCRNVLIYFNSELQRKTLGILHFALNLNGYLFLGPSESAEIIKDSLEVVSKKWNIF